MDNAARRQSKRVNEPAHRPAAPGRDVLLALATAWSTSHGGPSVGLAGMRATPVAAARTFPAGHVTRRWARSR